MAPTGICIHNTANDASARQEVAYMQSNPREVSFHFAVDDVEIVQGVPCERNTWHAGDGAKGYANRRLISLEICYSKSGGKRFENAQDRAATLCAWLCKTYGWYPKDITKHNDYTATACPHRTLEYGWERFLSSVERKMEEARADGESVPKQMLLLEELRHKNTQQKVEKLQQTMEKIHQLSRVDN